MSKSLLRDEIEGFKRALGVDFEDKGLLELVFIHKSYLNEKGGAAYGESNERLEFLGDAVLSCVISRMLYEKFPLVEEGELTRMRARLVNKRALAQIGVQLDMGRHLRMGKGEKAAGGASNPTVLAGAFEALLGALYMEAGLSTVSVYIERLFAPLLDDALSTPGHFDFKPRLQELVQRNYKEGPVYRLVGESGLAHRKTFNIEVVVNGHVMGAGSAATKKEAEQAAAAEALKRLEAEGQKL
ncbi:MAG: ribonuclease III [Deltaproteobacteria bacterium RIFCSPLOWO2_02_FULL_53_8]|nr:MAG: ribonuclease III [Deltaproteobacteria bacterium RIFCSPLOWO2_02_FULL_53_8]